MNQIFFKEFNLCGTQSTRMATSPFQSNSLRGQGEDQQLKSNVLPGLPDGFLVVDLHPGHVKSLTGMVT